MLIAGASFWVGTLLQKLSYDPVKDFLPVTIVSREANVVVVHPSLPVTNIKDANIRLEQSRSVACACSAAPSTGVTNPEAAPAAYGYNRTSSLSDLTVRAGC